jgi:hypothetical protein
MGVRVIPIKELSPDALDDPYILDSLERRNMMVSQPTFKYVIFDGETHKKIAGAEEWEDAKRIADLFPKCKIVGYLRGY